MQIIPAINCLDFECVKEKLKKTAEFLPAGGWIQLDIADGKFTSHKTWSNPEELSLLITQYSLLNLEVHLMVEKPEAVIEDWVKAGAKRIIVHLEALDTREFSRIWPQISQMAEIGLAVNPDMSVEKVIPYISANQQKIGVNQRIKFIQILAVDPGASGQEFQPLVLNKVKFLKKNYPDVIIEVDGGINLETAKLCKEAGADILAAATYIFDSPDPKEAYKVLSSL